MVQADPRTLRARSGGGTRRGGGREGRRPGLRIRLSGEYRRGRTRRRLQSADVIVSDFGFAGGAFADWLSLWPLPCVVLLEGGEEPSRVEGALRDESSFFLLRDAEGAWLALLPLLLRKAYAVREAIARQNAHLAMTEHQYLNLMRAIPDLVYVLDGEGRFRYVNEAARTFGWEPANLIGRHFSAFIHPDDLASVSREEALPPLVGKVTTEAETPKLFDERRSGERMTRNLEVRLRIGEDTSGPFSAKAAFRMTSVNAYGEVNAVGYSMPEFNAAFGTIGVIRDVTLRREHERGLERDLMARETLLREIHHRVKNNLQVVSSLLNLQQHVVEDERSRTVFLECQTQIQSMALVHEQIYRHAELDGISIKQYLESLVGYLCGVYETELRGLGVEVLGGPDLRLDLDCAIPAAIIVNELVSNAFKHAFPKGRRGTVRVRVDQEPEGGMAIEVSDDGIGFAASRAEIPPDRPRSLGLDLVAALTQQLRGTIVESEDGGARTLLRFRYPVGI